MSDETDPPSDPIAALFDNLRSGLTRKQSMRAAGLTVKSLAALISANQWIVDASDAAEAEGKRAKAARESEIANGQVSDDRRQDARGTATQVPQGAEQRPDAKPVQNEGPAKGAAQVPATRSMVEDRSHDIKRIEASNEDRRLPDPCELCGQARVKHPPRGCPKAIDVADPSGLRALAVAVTPAEKKQSVTIVDAPRDGQAERWADVLDEAAALGPGLHGITRWIDSRAQKAQPDSMHGLDPWWDSKFGEFFTSGKRIMVCRKGLRAGGSSSAMVAMLACAIGADGPIDPSVVGVAAVLSSSRDEATDRFTKLRKLMRAAGIGPETNSSGRPKSEDESDDESLVMPGGIGDIYKSRKSLSGGGIFEVCDRRGQAIEARILPAMRRAVIGWTGRAIFLDETSMWPDDPDTHTNPADEIIRLAIKRCTTQDEARIFIFSASYQKQDAHSKRVDLGDTSAQFIARLGELGAQRDYDARLMLAHMTGSTDPRLLAMADPMSPNIPAWVGNPSKASIDKCYRDSDDQIGDMLALYGGQPLEHGKKQAVDEDGEYGLFGEEHRDAGVCSDDRGYE